MACNLTTVNIAMADDSTPSHMYRVFVTGISTTLIILGNLANSCILPRMNSLNKISKIFFVNLSIADLLVGLSVGIPAMVTAIVNDEWLFGEPYCYFSGLLHTISCVVSEATLTAICVVRYIAIARPFKYRMISGRRCIFVCSFIWLYSIAVHVSPITNRAIVLVYALPYGFCTVCWLQMWPALLLIVTILIPTIIALIVSGAKIICVLRRKFPGEPTRNNESARREKMALRLALVTTISFCVCWLPFLVFSVARTIIPSLAYEAPTLVRFSVMWLGNANSFVNVCIYSSIYPEYRKKLKQVMLCWRPSGQVVTDVSAVTSMSEVPPSGRSQHLNQTECSSVNVCQI